MTGESADVLDDAVESSSERAFLFLENLVACPSVVGAEQLAQEVVATELASLGLVVEEQTVPVEITEHRAAGVPQVGYIGRFNVVGRTDAAASSGIVINGHVDVVPADPTRWAADPFRPVRKEGWLFGRGAGDMKGGFAMAALALRGLREAVPAALEQPLSFLSVIEEECTGNGTLAAARRGVVGDAVVLPEPTDLGLLLGGVGVLWVEITVTGPGAHAESADRSASPLRAAAQAVAALQAHARQLTASVSDPALVPVASPYNVNVGTVHAGDWPSTVPTSVAMGVRVGFPRGWSADEALASVREVVDGVAASAGLSVDVRPSGFRAEGYLLDEQHWLVTDLAACHTAVTGGPPRTYALGSTTDARYYVNEFDRPALCYGPRVRNIHGTDEAVELASVVTGAKVLARFLAGYAERGGVPVDEGPLR